MSANEEHNILLNYLMEESSLPWSQYSYQIASESLNSGMSLLTVYTSIFPDEGYSDIESPEMWRVLQRAEIILAHMTQDNVRFIKQFRILIESQLQIGLGEWVDEIIALTYQVIKDKSENQLLLSMYELIPEFDPHDPFYSTILEFVYKEIKDFDRSVFK